MRNAILPSERAGGADAPVRLRGSRVTVRTDSRPRATHRAANRVVDILELVARSRDGLPLREVSAELEAPKRSLPALLELMRRTGDPPIACVHSSARWPPR
jgi:hypothetical protein